MRREDNKGFTLAELLIVVAIIGVLVAISIPIFSKQLEKARDATSVANLRSAYAEAMTEYLNPDLSMKSGKGLVIKDSNGKITMSVNFKSATSSTITSIAVYNVDIESKKRNNWSGLGENLPFYSTLQPDSQSHGDIGKSGKGNMSYSHMMRMVILLKRDWCTHHKDSLITHQVKRTI